ncbi:hypothetical protein [Hyalangium rubrum]|uniref:Uncharacterized protein n=1 Tax=Hyalangium rubrum TaxID=3103134 RepID=A0ABU5GYT4_9BACT|nr:hypothetical protein [Hyalangium sp. s54d21]MDY7226354.1 hypothetical protein [Hyalangium sp. s54d21]
MDDLSRQLQAHADRLAASSVEWMYQDPFWEARYGIERARRFGSEDAHFHVRYLVQALTEQRPSVLEGYAVWLRTLLVSRGMCTLHLDQNFAGLQAALAAEGFGPDSPAHGYVQAARDALRYAPGPARTLQDSAVDLAHHAVQVLGAEVPAPFQARLEQELMLHLSYLADAVGTGHPEFFAQHLSWYATFWPRREFGVLPFARLLEALEAALAHSPSGQDEVKAVFSAARTPSEASPS